MNQKELWENFYRNNPRAWRGVSEIPVPCDGTALELGCGNGKTAAALLEAGMEVYGADFSETAVKKCRELYPRAVFEVCDISRLPFDDGMFDYVVAVHVIENLEDEALEKTTAEIARVLKDGGYLFVRCFTPRDMRAGDRRNGLYYRYYSAEDIAELFEGMLLLESREKDEPTRFGTIRSRAECLFRKCKDA